MRLVRRAFTLVEILIVVVILGILASIIVPQFARASEQAQETATLDQLEKVRRAIGVYYVRHAAFPDVTAGDGTWGPMMNSNYFRSAPVNAWVGTAARTRIVIGTGPDSAYQSTHGWIYNPVTGEVWAGSFDSQDRPIPRP